MIIETTKAFAVAALLVATGSANSIAYAPASGLTTDAASRISAAFEVVAEMPPVEPVDVPMARKGDLLVPLGCIDVPNHTQVECKDTAYKVLTDPSLVVATSFGNTTTLMRMDAMAVADVIHKVFEPGGPRESVVFE